MSSRKTRRIGIRDVARLAGVAPTTVSRALSLPSLVSEETRLRIAEAIASTGYIPNRVAANLSSNQTKTIGAVIPTLRNSIAADFTEGMAEVLRREGFQLLLGSSDFSPEEEEAIVVEFIARRVDGIYLTGSTHTARTRQLLRSNRIPTVEIATLPDDPIDMASGFSNFDAGYRMTRMLAEEGYRKVALLTTFTRDNERQSERLAGYRAAVAEFGLDDDARLFAEVEMSLKSGGEALGRLLDVRPDLDAIFCTGDIIAAGVLFECQRRGIDVPGRIAIAGFEGLDISENVVPPLTTVRIPRKRIGMKAAEMLLDRIAGRTPSQPKMDLGFEIVRRASTIRTAGARRKP